LPLQIKNPGNFNEPHIKTNVLLQSHFSRIELSAAVKDDQVKIIPDANRLLQAMVDVISSNGWLLPALATMELSQMITQGVWNTDSPLMQLPFVTKQVVDKLKQAGVNTVSEVMEMEDDQRESILNLSEAKMNQVALFCNAYPDLEVKFEVSRNPKAGAKCEVMVTLSRDEDEDVKGVPKAISTRYPQVKAEGWWLVLGDANKNELVSIKRVAMKADVMQVPLSFQAPKEGNYAYKLYLMSDSYIGVDQEFPVNMTVAAGEAMSDGSGSDDSDSD